MSTPVKPAVDTKAIAHLDFSVKCERQLLMRLACWWLPLNRCRRPAKWLGIMPCSHETFSCNRHRNGMEVRNECGHCGRVFDDVADWKWFRV